jgi:hypothetical protein
MSFDPKVCRKHSVCCAEMASRARTPQLRQAMLDLAKGWGQMALQIERNLALSDDLAEMGSLKDDRRPGRERK